VGSKEQGARIGERESAILDFFKSGRKRMKKWTKFYETIDEFFGRSN